MSIHLRVRLLLAILSVGLLTSLPGRPATSAALSLVPAATAMAPNLTVNVVLKQTTGAPAALQWTVNYAATDITAISVTAGAAALAAGKSLTCAQQTGAFTCVLAGINQTSIPDGVIGVLALTVPSIARSLALPVSRASGSAADGSGMAITATGATVDVTTPGDTTPPSVRLSLASGSTTVSGTVAIGASATDNIGVAGVQFQVDGVNLGPEFTGAPYGVTWNTTTVPNGAHTITAVARDAAGNHASSAISVTVANTSAGALPLRINAGGAAYTDVAGTIWSADSGASGGYTSSTTVSIAGTTSPVLYQTSRWCACTFQYEFPVPSGLYRVKLKFSENAGSAPGQHLFNVNLNGQAVLTNFDVFAGAGGNFRAVDRDFETTAASQITIQFVPVMGTAKVSALEIVRLGAVPVTVTVNPLTASVAAGGTAQFSATVAGSTDTAVTWTVTPAVGAISSTGLYTAPAYVFAAQTVTITATSHADSSKSASATVSVAAGGTGVFSPIRINAGGAAYTDSLGQSWSADTGYSGGSVYTSAATISGTTAPTLYQSLRWFPLPFQYQFAVPAGTYRVNLKFAEIETQAAGQRVFDVTINSVRVLSGFDIVARAGAIQRALDVAFQVASTGTLTIQFQPVINAAQINAIEILKVNPASPAAPALAAGATEASGPAEFKPIRVRAGGGSIIDAEGRVWVADAGYSGGVDLTTGAPVSGTSTPALYQAERWSPETLRYRFAVPGGAYRVTLMFAENTATSAGERLFDVRINGVPVLVNFDIFAEAGGNFRALERTFDIRASGEIAIDLVPVIGVPKISAIEIR